jgi:hypothetical protein
MIYLEDAKTYVNNTTSISLDELDITLGIITLGIITFEVVAHVLRVLFSHAAT